MAIKAKNKYSFFTILIISVLTLLSIYNILSSELGLYDISKRPIFYIFFILFALIMLIFLLFNGSMRIPPSGKICLAISLYWSIKVGLSIYPTDYDILSVEYSFYWSLAIIFAYNYFKRVKNDMLFVDTLFYSFIIICFFNISTYYYSLQFGVPMIPLVYNSIIFLPWILLSNERKKYIGIIILILLSLMSGKRGAIIILTIEALLGCYFLLKSKSSLFNKVGVICLTIISFYFIYQNLNTETETLINQKFSTEELADGSGRADINEYGINAIKQIYSLKELFFGYSLGSKVLRDFGGHNDWLTYMLYYGLIGVILYLILYIRIIKGIVIMYRNKSNVFIPYLSLFVIMIVLSLISSSYNPVIHPLIGMLFIGYAESKIA